MYDCVVIGSVCLDVFPRFKNQVAQELGELIIPGRILELLDTVVSLGGGVSNTGINLNKLGVKTALTGKIGTDVFGKLVAELFRKYGEDLADNLIETQEAATAHTVIINPPWMDRAFLHCPGATRTFQLEDVPFELVENSRLLHFAYPTLMSRLHPENGKNLAAIFRRAKELGATTSLDLAMPDPNGPAGQVDWQAILAQTLPYVDIFTPSFEETLYMLDHSLFLEREARHETLRHLTEDAPKLATRAIELGAGIVLLKVGSAGAYLRTRDELDAFWRSAPKVLDGWAGRELWAPTFRPAQVAGTTGAGDASVAGFLAAILRGLPPVDSLLTAVGVGACSVETSDSLSGVRDWEETRARIESRWEQVPLELTVPGWSWDQAARLWVGPRDRGAGRSPARHRSRKSCLST